MPLHPRRSRRRVCVYCAMLACTVFLVCGLLHAIFAHDPFAAMQATALSSFTQFHRGGGSMTSSNARHLLENVDSFLTARGAPSQSSVDISQFVFVSCNRHDQDQDYWRLMANAAQCESASWWQRAQSSQCFALYAGLETGPKEGRGRSVEQGGCGALLPPASLSDQVEEAAFSRPVDALVWLGDAIYADKREGGSPSMPLRSHADNPLSTVERFWITQRRSPVYTRYRQTCIRRKPGLAGRGQIPLAVDHPHGIASPWVPAREDFKLPASAPDVFAVYGTWDDHDMGENDGGADYPYRNITQRFLLNFIGADSSDTRWHREGVYTFHTIPFRDVIVTDATNRDDSELSLLTEAYVALQHVYESAICVILLDSRSFRDTPNAAEAGDMLGPAQWSWLEDLLVHNVSDVARGPSQKRHCALTVVGTGVQLILDEKPGENWGAFPRSRDKLFGLIKHHGAERVAFLTGDIHMGEIAMDTTHHAVNNVLGYPVVEITSSGLTHSAGDFKGLASLFPTLFPTPRRVGIYMEKNFASVRLVFDLDRLKTNVQPLLRDLWFPSTQHRHAHVEKDDALGVEAGDRPNEVGGTSSVAITDLQCALESALNVSFASFALSRYGQPAVRLNMPLEVLTPRRGPQYAAAGLRVLRPDTTGYIAPPGTAPSSSSGPSAHGFTTIETHVLGRIQVAHYPNASPQPLIMWLVRTAQHVWFRERTIPQTLVALIKRTLFLSTVTTLIAIWFTYRVMQRRQRRNRQGIPRTSNSAQAMPSAISTGSGRGRSLHVAFAEHEGSLGASGYGYPHGSSPIEMTPSTPPSASATHKAGGGVAPGGATSVSISSTAGALYDLFVGESKQKTV